MISTYDCIFAIFSVRHLDVVRGGTSASMSVAATNTIFSISFAAMVRFVFVGQTPRTRVLSTTKDNHHQFCENSESCYPSMNWNPIGFQSAFLVTLVHVGRAVIGGTNAFFGRPASESYRVKLASMTSSLWSMLHRLGGVDSLGDSKIYKFSFVSAP